MHETEAAEVIIARCLIKWLATCGTEWFAYQPDFLATCWAIGYFLQTLYACTARQATSRKQNIQKGRPWFYSDNISHFIQEIYMDSDKR